MTDRSPEPLPPVEDLGPAPVATAAGPRPRAYRTPERTAPPVFTAPEPVPPPLENEPHQQAPLAAGPPSRATAALVIFRATARTALQGFDVRVTYPSALGSFAANGQEADCSSGSGTLLFANNLGPGQLKLVVASGQALPLPLDVFCRFALAPGAGLDSRAFTTRVVEVTSGNAVADPSLLIINVVVR